MTHPLNDHVLLTRCPVVATEVARIARRMQLDGLTYEMAALRFERKIHWVRESETRTTLKMGGTELKEGSEFTDFSGFLTSFDGNNGAIAQARAWANREGIGRSSSVSVEAVVEVFERPVIDVPADLVPHLNPPYPGQTRFFVIPKDWVRDDDVLEAWLKASDAERIDLDLHFFKRRLVERATVWSSKLSEEENLRTIQDFTDGMREGTGL